MYCPQCLAEYEEGFTECADCQVAFLPGPPPQPVKESEVELITVLETAEPIALSLAKASLAASRLQCPIDFLALS